MLLYVTLEVLPIQEETLPLSLVWNFHYETKNSAKKIRKTKDGLKVKDIKYTFRALHVHII